MLTIKNNTDRVVTVYNGYFQKEIPINEAISIPDDEMQNDHTLKIKYFSLKSEQADTNIEIKRDFRRKIGVDLYNDSQFPIVTAVNAQNKAELTIEEDDTPLPFLALFFKRATLKRLYCPKLPIAQSLFCNATDKKQLLRLLRWELLFMIPFAILLVLATVVFWIERIEMTIAIVSSVLTILFVFCDCWNIYYYRSARKWRVDSDLQPIVKANSNNFPKKEA